MVCDMIFICPQLDFGFHVIGSILKQYRHLQMPHVRLKLIIRWCVRFCRHFNDGTNCRPVSMISNLTETLMCLIEETGDSTHKRTGRGSWEAVNPSPLRLPNFKQLRFFGQQKKFWQCQFLQKFPCFFSPFFFFQRDIYWFKLKQTW